MSQLLIPISTRVFAEAIDAIAYGSQGECARLPAGDTRNSACEFIVNSPTVQDLVKRLAAVHHVLMSNGLSDEEDEIRLREYARLLWVSVEIPESI